MMSKIGLFNFLTISVGFIVVTLAFGATGSLKSWLTQKFISKMDLDPFNTAVLWETMTFESLMGPTT